MSQVIAFGDRLEIKFYCADAEQGSVNTINFQAGNSTGGSITDQDVANYFDEFYGSTLKDFIANTASYQGTTCRIANLLPLPVPALASAHSGVGVAGAVGLPRQTAGLLDFRTAVAGPGGRGRMFFPFPATTANETLGKPLAGYVTSMSNFGTDLIAVAFIPGFGGASLQVSFVLWSPTHARMVPIVSAFGATSWATQKRRGGFGRPNAGPF